MTVLSKRFELKDLFAHQLEWQEHSRRISESVVSGKLPLGFAASALNTTFVDAAGIPAKPKGAAIPLAGRGDRMLAA
jgi:hypothetical protein